MSGTEIRVGGRFRLGKKIGSGSFGEIFIGIFNSPFISLWIHLFIQFIIAVNIQTGEDVAIKLVSSFKSISFSNNIPISFQGAFESTSSSALVRIQAFETTTGGA